MSNLIQSINELRVKHLGFEDICVLLKLTSATEKSFVRDIVLKKDKKEAA